MDIGCDLASAVTDDAPKGEYQGKIQWVRVDLEEDDVSHLEPEDLKYHRIISKQ